MPTIIVTNPFKKDLLSLSKEEQNQAKKTIRFLAENPRHPSLQTHKIKGTPFIEAYVNKDIRIVFEATRDTLTLLAIGHHDILRKY